MANLPFLIPALAIFFASLLLVSCNSPDNSVENAKASSLLLIQVNLRKAQISNPTPDRLNQMKNMGMNVDNLSIQRIFMHLNQPLTKEQENELKAIDITLYVDSWIPPVGNFPTGYLIADMPVDKLVNLAQKSFVVRLDTAEKQLQPQNEARPQ